jgi:hypothetical protein
MGGTEKTTPVFHFPRSDNRQRSMPAYKALWIMAGKPIPDGHLIYRHCINRCCVNPNTGHCKSGTTKTMWQHLTKNGKFKGNPNRTAINRMNAASRRTPETVIRQIETMLADGVKREDIAARLNIDRHVITQVRQRRHFYCATRPRVIKGASVFAL